MPKDAALIPIIGFLNHYKYTDVIYNALDRFFDKETDLARVVFIFCGDGPLRSPGERRFAVNNNVRFWGWQPRAVIQALLCESSLVVVPMSGFVLIEAASAGIPVVTSAIEWHSEFVENGVSGLVVPPEKCDAWRLAIAWLLRNSHKANVMGMRLKQKYLNDYSPADLKKREIDLYLNVAADVGNTRKARRLFRSPGTSQKE